MLTLIYSNKLAQSCLHVSGLREEARETKEESTLTQGEKAKSAQRDSVPGIQTVGSSYCEDKVLTAAAMFTDNMGNTHTF